MESETENPSLSRAIELAHPDHVPRWYFSEGIDLDYWLPAITTHPGDGQNNDGALIAAFHPEFAPSVRHGKLLAAAHEMFLLLKAGLPLLREAAVENEDKELRVLCDEVAERIADIESSEGDDTVRPAW